MPPRPLRVSSPGDLVALVPHLTGFTPTESLVALSLRGRRRRLGLTVRADLVEHPGVVDQVVRGLVADRATACAVLVHTDRPSLAGAPGDRTDADLTHPWAELVGDLVHALAAHGIAASELLLVRRGRWWSYGCTGPCCPPEGTPVDVDTPVVRAVAVEHVLSGEAVLSSRADLVTSLAARPVLGPAVAGARLHRAEADLTTRWSADPDGARLFELARWRAAVDAWEQRPAAPPPDEAAALAIALRRVPVRDQVVTWALERSDPLLGLLGELCRATPAPYDVPVCTAHAWVAYSRGNGGLARIGLERTLASDPDYGLATLLLAALDAVLPPAEVRALLRAVA